MGKYEWQKEESQKLGKKERTLHKIVQCCCVANWGLKQFSHTPWRLLEKYWWTSKPQGLGNPFDTFSATYTAKLEYLGSRPSRWAMTKKIQTKYTTYIGSFINGNALHYRLALVLDFREAMHSFMKPPFSCLPVVEQFIFFETVHFFPLQRPHSAFIFLRL